MREKVLITGASGFVGFHLIKECLKIDLDVHAAIRKSSEISHLQTLGIKFRQLVFDDIQSLKTQLHSDNYSYIIHAAGITKALTAADYNMVNARYTYNLAVAAAGNTGIKKFIFISSLAAIGPLNTLEGKIDENTIPAPVTSYGKSKLLAEERLKSVAGLNYTILRPTGIYGPRDKDIFIMFKQIANGIEPYIGRLPQKLSLIYVTDLARAAINALQAPPGSAYNLSDGHAYDRYAIGNLTKQILKKKAVKLHLPVGIVKFIAAMAEKYAILTKKAAVLNTEKLKELMAANWDCSIALAKAEIAFKPAYDLTNGLEETLKWYLKNNWL